nr:MAG TPA: hypothetical protein [Caudoviricetes sp.]
MFNLPPPLKRLAGVGVIAPAFFTCPYYNTFSNFNLTNRL